MKALQQGQQPKDLHVGSNEPVDPSERHCCVGDVAEAASTAEGRLPTAEASSDGRREEGRAEEPEHE